MNLETTIIGAIMLVLFIVAFVFLSGSTKSKKNPGRHN